ncbi:hypothetical protein PCASD_21700 [Puccinia coronata f. sp. avenae]|uniref:Uncharacterized protein n=1 Tax=Puccinia coronata f. sp. avenae TaxID=200324 RepID=A0A2N5TRB3_9BASI|nr:hypothetical protein PCASD_21700 [Puccinia coronata f. sp. avenae]
MPSISISSDSQLGPLDSPELDSESSKSKHSELQEKRDALATLVFKCLALALSNHCENQLFFLQSSCLSLYRTPFGFPTSFHSRPQGIAQTGSTHYRRQKIEKLFGIFSQQREASTSSQNLANRGSEDSSHSNAHPAVVMLNHHQSRFGFKVL